MTKLALFFRRRLFDRDRGGGINV